MHIDKTVKLFVRTGHLINEVLNSNSENELFTAPQKELFRLVKKVNHDNGWFSETSVRCALQGIVKLLDENDLLEWVSKYLQPLKDKTTESRVGIIMAGNLPLVGFSDFLCVLVAGDFPVIKMSSDDTLLLPAVLKIMEDEDESLKQRYEIIAGPIQSIEKVIATGSDNTARYFEYYFKKYPNIIRKSRTSLAIVHAEITPDEIRSLSKDLFYYYGLGCRNVSHLLLPEGFDVTTLIDVLREFNQEMDNVKYVNNLDYHKSVMLINSQPFLDGGFFLMKESTDLFSPISITNYHYYNSEADVQEYLNTNASQLQCIIDQSGTHGVSFGEGQFPKLWDYPDKVDVLQFLLS